MPQAFMHKFAIMKNFRVIATGLFLLFFVTNASAQKPYFVYLQTENQEPFFVQLNKKNYSSSSAGHVILSGLTNGNYTIQVGFSGQNALQEYSITINNEDQGYLVKKFDNEFGIINLQSLTIQLSGVAQKAAEDEKKKAIAAAEAQKMEETRIAEETAFLEKQKMQEAENRAKATEAKLKREEEIRKEEESIRLEKNKLEEANKEQEQAAKLKKEEEAKRAETTKSVALENNSQDAATSTLTMEKKSGMVALEKTKETKEDEIMEKPVVQVTKEDIKVNPATKVVENPIKEVAASTVSTRALTPAEIAKLQEEARRIDSQGKRDSVLNPSKNAPAKAGTPAFLDIDFTMPANSTENSQGKTEADSVAINNWTDSMAIKKDNNHVVLQTVAEQKTESTKEAIKTEETTTTEALRKAQVVIEQPKGDSAKSPQTNAATPVKNTNCIAEATEADVELISMIIKGEKQPEDALDIARKSIKVKCVTTTQLRKLVLLFDKQEDRYTLLDIAYRYTLDKDKYAVLGDLLTDTYYLNRFKAMVQ